jgi:SAM-dependent MidA family methyltransferase
VYILFLRSSDTLLYRLNHRLPYFFGAGFLILCGILARMIREQSDEELAAMVAAEEAEAHGKAGLADVTSSADYQHLTESPDSNGRL